MFGGLAVLSLILAANTLASPVSKHAFLKDWDTRIINGEDAKQGEFPSQVSLQYLGGHMCGASVVNEYWILTAGHCAQMSANDMSVYVGSIDLLSGGSRHAVEKIHVHQDYIPGVNFENDIALLKVKTPFNIDGVKVQAVKLPEQGKSPAEGSRATVIGWGSLKEGESGTTHLQKVDIEIFSQDKCKEIYSDININIIPGNICGHFTSDARGACHGDSGGPLFVDGVVVGLVNGGIRCAYLEWPSVYARVDYYIDWIQQHLD